eukprot:m.84228 g.84228  ORF g.84228 m.84228 type:complete len:230 (-) comp9587_c0_seq2:35-724(-)
MSACREEHHAHGGGGGSHGHGHSHGGGGCEDHDPDPERGFEETLYPFVDIPQVTCLNESTEGAGRSCIRPWSERADETKFVESDADEQLLFFIPFTGNVKLKTIVLITANDETRPTVMKAYKNRDDIDFDLAESLTPTQEWSLVETPAGHDGLRYETRASQFQGLHSLTLFFPENAGGDTSKILYIGLIGTCDLVVRRTVIKIAEFAANPADHKTEAEDKVATSIQPGY